MNTRKHEPITLTARHGWMLAGLLLVCMLPFVAAHYLHYVGWHPSSYANQGELLPQTIPIDSLSLEQSTPVNMQGKWVLMYLAPPHCEQACYAQLEKLKQVHAVMGKNHYRLVRLALLREASAEQVAKLTQQFPRMGVASITPTATDVLLERISEPLKQSVSKQGCAFIVDPHGNVLMAYSTPLKQDALFTDLKRLLAYSHIG